MLFVSHVLLVRVSLAGCPLGAAESRGESQEDVPLALWMWVGSSAGAMDEGEEMILTLLAELFVASNRSAGIGTFTVTTRCQLPTILARHRPHKFTSANPNACT